MFPAPCGAEQRAAAWSDSISARRAGTAEPLFLLPGAEGRCGYLRKAWFVGQIGQLDAVEKQLRGQKAGSALRLAMRVWQSASS